MDDPKFQIFYERTPEDDERDANALRIYSAAREDGQSMADALLRVDTAIGDFGISMIQAIRAFEKVGLKETKELFFDNLPMLHPNFPGRSYWH